MFANWQLRTVTSCSNRITGFIITYKNAMHQRFNNCTSAESFLIHVFHCLCLSFLTCCNTRTKNANKEKINFCNPDMIPANVIINNCQFWCADNISKIIWLWNGSSLSKPDPCVSIFHVKDSADGYHGSIWIRWWYAINKILHWNICYVPVLHLAVSGHILELLLVINGNHGNKSMP